MPHAYDLPTPARLQRQIERAEEMEDELDSLPSFPPHDTTTSEETFNRRPRHGYDVGLREVSSNTPFPPRTHHHSSLAPKTSPKPLPASKIHLAATPKLRPKTNKADQPQFLIESPLTSTPATSHHARGSSRPGNLDPSGLRRVNENAHPALSPNGSRISRDEEAHKYRENMIILSTSGSSAAESDAQESSAPAEDSPSSSDSEGQGNLSRKSLGDIDFGDLDDYASGLDHSYSQRGPDTNTQAIKSPKNSSALPPRACPSPSAASHSSSQSTLIAKLPNNDSSNEDSPIHNTDPTNPHQRTSSHISSPGLARRDSPRHGHSYSIDDMDQSLSRDLGPEYAPSKDSSFDQNSSAVKPEPTPARHRALDQINEQSSAHTPFTAMATRKNLLLSDLKSAQPIVPLRSARRTHVPRHLAEVGEDTSDLSGFPYQQPGNRSPPQPFAETDTDSTSHDLTTYPATRHDNGNTSFPVGDRSQRFNGNKLNSFLHSLNTQLTQENQQMLKTLAETNKELQRLRKENQSLHGSVAQSHTSSEDNARHQVRHGSPDRSEALIGQLEGILETHHNIADLQSKFNGAQGRARGDTIVESSGKIPLLERQINRLKSLVEERDADLQEMRHQLLDRDRSQDMEPLKQVFDLKEEIAGLKTELAAKDDEVVQVKMQHIELSGQHASAVAELRGELEQAQQLLLHTEKDLAEARSETEKTKDLFATKIESLKVQIGALMEDQDNKIASTTSQLNEARRLADKQAKELAHLKSENAKREQDFQILPFVTLELDKLLNGQGDLSLNRSVERKVRSLQSQLESVISSKKQAAQDLSSFLTQAAEQQTLEIQSLRKQIVDLQSSLDQVRQDSSDKSVLASQLEDALRESESARFAREMEIAELNTQIDLLEAKSFSQQSTIEGLEVRLAKALRSAFSDATSTSARKQTPTPSRRRASHGPELEEAHQEIDRLKALLGTPNEIANNEIQRVKIEALEAHRLELEERVGSLRHQASALISTPSRSYAFQSIISMRTPNTPGKMLANMTTLGSESTEADETIVPLLTQIQELHQQVEQLRHQLDVANENVDKKLAKLAEAGEKTVDLSSQVLAARARADELEKNLDRLIGENGTIAQVKQRLANVGCPDCGGVFDANEIVRFRVVPEAYEVELTQTTDIDTEERSSTLLTRFKELEASHQESNEKIDSLTRELELKTKQLEELESKQDEDEQEIEQLQNELSATRIKLESLEQNMKQEQERLRAITKSQQEAATGKQALEEQLEEMNQRLGETQDELDKVSQARDSMDAELRALHQLKGDSDQLSGQISKLQSTITKLESDHSVVCHERTALVQQTSDLRREIEKQGYTVSTTEKSYHRVQALLERQTQEISGLKDQLESKTEEICRLRKVKDDVLGEAKELKRDLTRVQTEAQELGHDLEQIKAQAGRQVTPLSAKETTRIRDELALCKKQLAKYTSAEGQQKGETESRESIEMKHNSECKGLLLRIRYLKVLYTRENMFRADLATQKRLIMAKLGDTEVRNAAIQVTLENFGLPSSSHAGNFTIHTTERSFKGVAIAVRALAKLRILSRNWKAEERVKQKLKDAYQEVRGKEFVGE